MSRGLGTDAGGIYRIALAMNDIIVDPILDVRRCVRGAEESRVVALVFGQEQRDISFAVQSNSPRSDSWKSGSV